MPTPTWKILLVEDDEDDYILTRQMLTEARQAARDGNPRVQFALEWAPSFAAGLKKLESDNYDAILTDYDLGSHTGIDLIRQAGEKKWATPIIILTGRGSYEIDLEAMNAGAADYISKADLTPALLEKTLRYTIEHQQTKNELRAERDRLRRSEERFRLALANASIAVFTMDRDLRYTWTYNPRWGYTTEEMLGQRDDELDHVEDASELLAMKTWVIQNGKGIKGEAKACVNGEWLFYSMAIEPLWDENGHLIGLTAAAMDITDIRRLQNRQMEDAAHIEVQHRLIEQREMERMEVARDLHDGPLQELVGISFQLADALSSAPGDAQQERLRQVQEAVLRQIQEVRQFCHELRPPTLAPFGLERAIRSHAGNFQKRNPEIELALDLQRDGQQLPEDMRMALFRIYQELLNNIKKHANATLVLLRFAFDEASVSLEVRDNGAGFEQPSNWLLLARSGHLGLIGMRERVEALGGSIQVESAPGAGTSVQVRVPRKNPV